MGFQNLPLAHQKIPKKKWNTCKGRERIQQVNGAASPCLIQHLLTAATEVLQSIDSASPVSVQQVPRLTVHGPILSKGLGMAWFPLSWTQSPWTPAYP